MPGTGALGNDEQWEIEIQVKGPLSKLKADEFDAELRTLLAKYQAAMTKAKTRPKTS